MTLQENRNSPPVAPEIQQLVALLASASQMQKNAAMLADRAGISAREADIFRINVLIERMTDQEIHTLLAGLEDGTILPPAEERDPE